MIIDPFLVNVFINSRGGTSPTKNGLKCTKNGISSNKSPRRLFNFETLRCSGYWREALISKSEVLLNEVSKLSYFLFPNNNK